MIKNKIFLIAISLCNLGLSQKLNENSFVTPQKTAEGFPITNVIDADGVKQGVWYYKNSDQSTCFSQQFFNNNLVNSSVLITDKTQSFWKNISDFQHDNQNLNQVKELLYVPFYEVRRDNYSSKQFFVYRFNNTTTIELLGDWTDVSTIEFKLKINTLINTTYFNDDFFLFFE